MSIDIQKKIKLRTAQADHELLAREIHRLALQRNALSDRIKRLEEKRGALRDFILAEREAEADA